MCYLKQNQCFSSTDVICGRLLYYRIDFSFFFFKALNIADCECAAFNLMSVADIE